MSNHPMLPNESPAEYAVRVAKLNAAAQAANPQVIDAGTAVAVAPHTGTAVAMPAAQKLSMTDLMTGTLAVDEFVKVDKYGLVIGKNSKPIDSFRAIIDLREGAGFTPCEVVKYGQPVVYCKTYDRTRTADGKSWLAELARIANIDQKARPYPAADLVMTLLEDAGTGKAGQTVGYTTATTSFKHVIALLKKAEEKGLNGERVEVKVGFVMREKNNNTWGEMTFELIGPADSE